MWAGSTELLPMLDFLSEVQCLVRDLNIGHGEGSPDGDGVREARRTREFFCNRLRRHLV
jgi:hypothetical protein